MALAALNYSRICYIYNIYRVLIEVSTKRKAQYVDILMFIIF